MLTIVDGHTVEKREGATGFSIELNFVQVFWIELSDWAIAQKKYDLLVAALKAKV